MEELCKKALTKYPTLSTPDKVATNSPEEEKKTGLDAYLGRMEKISCLKKQ